MIPSQDIESKADVPRGDSQNVVPFSEGQSPFDCLNEGAQLCLPAVFVSQRASSGPHLYRDLTDSDGNAAAEIIKEFIQADLDLSRLWAVHDFLYLAGQRGRPRALHEQIVLKRTITLTERLDLHLTWSGARLFIKPCPEYLLSHRYWTEIICGDNDLYGAALGMLLSYVYLIQRQSDLTIALAHNLLPRIRIRGNNDMEENISWSLWVKFSAAILARANVDDLRCIHPRFQHRELRLGRINMIYRWVNLWKSPHLIYVPFFEEYHEYGSFVQALLTPFALTGVIISVLSPVFNLGMSTEQLKSNGLYNKAAFAFVVTVICSSVVGMGVVLLRLLYTILANALYTMKLKKKWNRTAEALWKEQSRKEE